MVSSSIKIEGDLKGFLILCIALPFYSNMRRDMLNPLGIIDININKWNQYKYEANTTSEVIIIKLDSESR